MTEALVGRDIQQAVARHDPLPTGPAQPVVLRVAVPHEVQELRALHPADDVAARGLVPVTAVVMLGTAEVAHHDAFLLIPRTDVEAHCQRPFALADRLQVLGDGDHARPGHAIDHEQIESLGAAAPGHLVAPQQLPADGVVGVHGRSPQYQHDAAAGHQRPPVPRRDVGPPPLLAGHQVETHEGRSEPVENSPVVDRERQPPGHSACLLPPQHAPARAVDRDKRRLGLLLPDSDVRDRDPLADQDLRRRIRARHGRHDVTGRGVQNRERRPIAQSHVDPVGVDHDPTLVLGRDRRAHGAHRSPVLRFEPAPGPLAPSPLRERTPPQQTTVERVAADDRPSAGQTFVRDPHQTFVEDVDQTSPRCNLRLDA